MQSSLLLWIIPATLVGAVLSALLASVLLLFGARTRKLLVPSLVSFAIGALLGAAFLDLLPEALKGAGPARVQGVGLAIALGVLGFFLLEKLAFWHHGHEHEGHTDHDELRQQAAGTMILVGTGLHNLLDGVLLGATFLSSVHMGVVLAIAVIAHQIPQQVGDISVLLSSGVARGRAFMLSALSAATMVVGGVAAFFLLGTVEGYLPYVLAIAAASLIYVAVADLIPGLHRHEGAQFSVLTVLLIAAGIGLIYLTQALLGG
ncbi:MAG TPA: ZIP family metal transporter [Gammaproteobacteria bacterium]|jgi:zinc and cadmium transporter|nr:ZIP family metal transporter [Gammaproteobacteria bacterium]